MRRIPPAQRREELVAAAIRVIAARGVAAATTRAVTAEADMPLGAFSYIFGTQDELFTAVIDTVVEQERFAAEMLLLEAATLADAVRLGLEAYIALLEAEPDRELALLELGLFARRRSPDGQMRTQWQRYHAAAELLLLRVGAHVGVHWTTPVGDVARLLVTFIDGITIAWLADHDGDAARRTAAIAATTVAAHATDKEHTDAD